MIKSKLCSDCYELIYSYEPDMSDPVIWYVGICDRCEKRKIVFEQEDEA